jgi:thioredoxin-like negative regulator of GroEL
VLKKLEEEKNFLLVKIDIDKHQELAEMLNISSIPAMFLVYKGNMIDSFVGFPDTNTLNQFFENIKLIRGIAFDEDVIRSLLSGADEWMNKKQYERAESMLTEATSHKKWKEKYGHIIKLGLAICSYNKGEVDMAEKHLKDLKDFYKTKLSDPLISKKIALLEIKIMFNKNPDIRASI